jgi:hypothetical protein
MQARRKAIEVPNATAETALFDINNRGQMIGGFVDAAGAVTHFLLDDGVLTPIEFPGACEPSPSTSTTVARWWVPTKMPRERPMVFWWTKASSPRSIPQAPSKLRRLTLMIEAGS